MLLVLLLKQVTNGQNPDYRNDPNQKQVDKTHKAENCELSDAFFETLMDEFTGQSRGARKTVSNPL